MKSMMKSVAGKLKHVLGLGKTAPGHPFERLPYIEAYAAHTDQRVAENPHKAVGGMWEEIGQLQFAYLVSKGLSPHHRLLDIGCGTLRGGRHFVQFLQPGNYTGTDISLSAIEWGRQLIATEGLTDKYPRLIHRRSEDLFFLNFEQEGFDFILAQSVFTHLPPAIIDQCFASVGAVMRPQAVFYFTFKDAAKPRRSGRKSFRYPFRSLRN
jgi:SAM-dependent methyltransferase